STGTALLRRKARRRPSWIWLPARPSRPRARPRWRSGWSPKARRRREPRRRDSPPISGASRRCGAGSSRRAAARASEPGFETRDRDPASNPQSRDRFRTKRGRMAITGKWIFTAAMDVAPDKEALFNEVYDTEHIPLITKVPGVISATRVKLDTLRMTMGGETKVMDPQGAPRYAAI